MGSSLSVTIECPACRESVTVVAGLRSREALDQHIQICRWLKQHPNATLAHAFQPAMLDG